jgi:hypothetical protein
MDEALAELFILSLQHSKRNNQQKFVNKKSSDRKAEIGWKSFPSSLFCVSYRFGKKGINDSQ